MEGPKLFISYSWSSTDHEEWVLRLATTLREVGIDAILDKWDLKEGHDAFAFMESMVTDPEVKKVIMICDQTYAQKADSRAGGVGTETQIISAKVYQSQDQEKFVAVLSEKSPEGRPYLPTYYLTRKYIDLSGDDLYAQNLEHLIRWAYDKPLYIKPALGAAPAFLEGPAAPQLGTTAQFMRAKEAIRSGRPLALAALDDYLNTFVSNFERFRIKSEGDGAAFDDEVVRSIEEFLPYRNEFVSLLTVVCEHTDSQDYGVRLQRFFERLSPFLNYQSGASWRSWDFDNYRFIVHELFLYTIGLALKHERFTLATPLLADPYYINQSGHGNQESTSTYLVLWEPIESLEHRNSRLSLNRRSVWADLLKNRASSLGVDFSVLMQADLLLMLRSVVDQPGASSWFPTTLIYVQRSSRAFEIFARCISKKYLLLLEPLIGTVNLDKIRSSIEPIEKRTSYNFGWHHFTLEGLLGLKGWGSRP